MTDICSIWAYEEILDSGYLGKLQAQTLAVICGAYPNGVNADYIVENVQNLRGIRTRRWSIAPRLAELEDMGFIIKDKHTVSSATKMTVNTWKWSGKKRPREKVEKTFPCDKCNGSGVITKEVYIVDNQTQDEFDFI